MANMVAIANVKPCDVAATLQSAGYCGSVWGGLGFGAWGIEPSTFVESTDSALGIARALLSRYPCEDCVYVRTDADASLVYRDRIERLTVSA